MSAMSERLGRIERDAREAKTTTGSLDGRKMLADIEYLLGWISAADESERNPTTEPRIWRGPSTDASHWWWVSTEAEWSTIRGDTLLHNDVFVPGCHPRPDVAPERTSVLHTCTVVDWGVKEVGAAKVPDPKSEPRVWREDTIEKLHWWWNPDFSRWGDHHNVQLRRGDIFVAGRHPRPTTAPPAISDMSTCTVVDW